MKLPIEQGYIESLVSELAKYDELIDYFHSNECEIIFTPNEIMAKNNEKRVFEVSQELDKMSRLICFKYDAGIHLPESVIDWMTQEFICLYDADEDYPTLMPDEVITLRLMLRYIQL